jgi:GNAT superfamily N-acetyltransferase
MEWSRDEYIVTDDRSALDAEAVFGFLRESYWAKGISRETCLRSLENSLCFSLMHKGRQAGFSRAVTDRATFAYLGDVFVLPEHRGQGLAKWMLGCALAHPDLQGLWRMMLATADAHGLYRPLGFAPLAQPEAFLEIHQPYAAPAAIGMDEGGDGDGDGISA